MTLVGTPDDRVRSRAWLHLLWSVPLAVIVSVVPLVAAWFSLCGVSGCTGGGYGVTDVARPLVPFALLTGAVVMAVPFLAFPWARLRVRWMCAAVAAVVWLLVTGIPIVTEWRAL